MKILVTGSRGFIGTHLVKALREQKQDVKEFDLELGHDIAKSVNGDYDVIYNLAAFTLIQTRDNPQRAIDVNVKGIVNMLELARRCDAKIIFSSASSVYGIPRNDVVNETDTIQPVSIYGATKAAAEVLIETYHKLYDIDYFIFRFTNVYGPRQRSGVIPSFIKAIKKGEPIVIHGSGKQTRDFVFVADVVHFLVRMLEQNQKWRTVNLGSGVSTSIKDLVHALSSVVDVDLKMTTTGVDKDERWGFRADLTNLESAFKEVPKTSLKEGLKKTWEASQ